MSSKKATEKKVVEATAAESITADLKTVQIMPTLPDYVPKFDDGVIQKPSCLQRGINVKPKVLMGSGPTNPSQRVIEALSKPIMGLYDDDYLQVCVKKKTDM